MKSIPIQQVPNFLSTIRIAIAIAIIFIWNHTLIFFILYLVCGLTDILDGYLARKLGVVSKLGAQLDSVGDVVFFGVITFWLLFQSKFTITPLYLVMVLIIVLIRAFNGIITKLKFNRLGIMHTLLNKGTGAFCFLIVPILLVHQGIAQGFVLLLLLIGLVSSLEESVILIYSKAYQENEKSILTALKNKSR